MSLKKKSFLLLFLISRLASSQDFDILIKGSFYDDSTGLDLPTKVYSVSKGKKQFRGKSRREEIFNHRYEFNLDHKADSLVFESSRYQTKAFKINFHGKFTQNSSALLSIKTLRSGKDNISIRYTIFCKPPNTDNKYKILHYYGDTLHCENHVLALPKSLKDEKMTSNTSTSRYVIQTLSSANEVLSEVEYRSLPGINLVDVSAYPENETNENIAVNTTSKSNKLPEKVPELAYDSTQDTLTEIKPHSFEELGIPVLYFGQGKYTLEPETIKTLNEIAEYLINKKIVKRIKIKGYTDGVGDRILNEALAKYRAQVVYNYLINNGLKSDFFTVDWQKENELEKNETDLSQFRKVTLTEI
jgi:outer membrane protein OmpA-like peptidoglycan-associated protein